jgi:hypothetical protein
MTGSACLSSQTSRVDDTSEIDVECSDVGLDPFHLLRRCIRQESTFPYASICEHIVDPFDMRQSFFEDGDLAVEIGDVGLVEVR